MISRSENQTKKIAKKVLGDLKNQNVVLLYGDLGSGKTIFVKGIAEGLGIKGNVTSPTFVLIKEYHLENPMGSSRRPDKKLGLLRMTITSDQGDNSNSQFSKLIHIDLYRLQKVDQLFLDQLQEYIDDKSNLVVIEWAERLGKNLPKNSIKIKFKHIDENEREILLK